MATITGLTADRMQEIEGASIVDGEVVNGELILTKRDGTTINAGPVVGPAGPSGPAGSSAIPGEVKLWPSDTLPDPVTFGDWTWANGGIFDISAYPIAAANIAAVWKTALGAADPGVGKFRVPDLRGLIPGCVDALPIGSARTNRMTRAGAETIAFKTGEETHRLVTSELAGHSHGGSTGGESADHAHYVAGQTGAADRSLAHSHRTGWNRISTGRADGSSNMVTGLAPGGQGTFDAVSSADGAPDHLHALGLWTGGRSVAHSHGISTSGGDTPHENVQPTIFVPYIVFLG